MQDEVATGASAAPMRVIASRDELPTWVGKELACSDWLRLTQRDIDLFATATGDAQWIHIDVARAARESPFGTTVAHGFLTLSLLPRLFASCLRIEDVGIVVNYGLDKVRFPAPVLSGQRVRGRLVLEDVVVLDGGIMQARWYATVEIERGAKPACVAHMLTRYYSALPETAATDTHIVAIA